jgi:hypothetical protein
MMRQDMNMHRKSELLRSTGKKGQKRNVSGPFDAKCRMHINRFRKAEMGFIKALLLIPASLVLALVAFVVHHEWLKSSLDAQVRGMCGKDGGIKIYETVKLPANKFNEWGQVNFYKPNQDENALGPEYQMKRDTTYFRRGNPEMSRTHIQVFRTNDQKLLGEAVFYGRGGGDIPGPWYGSGLNCPEISAKTDVLRQVFVIDEGN